MHYITLYWLFIWLSVKNNLFQTDRPTDIVSYRAAIAAKNKISGNWGKYFFICLGRVDPVSIYLFSLSDYLAFKYLL